MVPFVTVVMLYIYSRNYAFCSTCLANGLWLCDNASNMLFIFFFFLFPLTGLISAICYFLWWKYLKLPVEKLAITLFIIPPILMVSFVSFGLNLFWFITCAIIFGFLSLFIILNIANKELPTKNENNIFCIMSVIGFAFSYGFMLLLILTH